MVYGLWFMVYGLGLRVWNLRFKVFYVKGLEEGFEGEWFKV